MKRYTVILDNGHGGMINGNYQTPGKRSPQWSKGILYEGAFNRWIVNKVMQLCDENRIPYYHVSPEIRDVALSTRVNRANSIFYENPTTYLLSIHANAGGGTGKEGFTSVGNTSSDAIAELFLSDLQKNFLRQKMRFDYSDGDKDKEANFYLLRKTHCPAVLLELGFMDNKVDYYSLWNNAYQDRLAYSLFESIEQLYMRGL